MNRYYRDTEEYQKQRVDLKSIQSEGADYLQGKDYHTDCIYW